MRSLLALATGRLGRGVLSLGLFAAIAVGAVNLDGRTVYARADAWTAVRTNALPNTLSELAAYPKAYRDAIIKALPAAEESRLWREQLQGVLDTQHDLSADQRAFIVKTMTQVTPESFEPNAEHPQVCGDVYTLFVDPDLRDRVSTLGAAASPKRTWRSRLVTHLESARALVTVRADLECDCSGSWCDFCFEKCDTTVACTAGQQCGCIWHGPCTGVCGGGGGGSSSTIPGTTVKLPIK